jgi:hypothetical protein
LIKGFLAGRVSGRLLYPEAKMFKNLPDYLRIGKKPFAFGPMEAMGLKKTGGSGS